MGQSTKILSSTPAPLSGDAPSFDPNATRLPNVVDQVPVQPIPLGASSDELFGKYRIIEPIKEEGAFGRIDIAEHTGLRQLVALKRLKRIAPEGDLGLSEEARAIAEVRHPNVVKINDYGKVGDVPFFEMEYMEGGSLQELLQRGLPDWKTAARFIQGMAEGVQSIHDRGIIHRDLKPANVLLDKDRVTPKVADFGLAHRVSSGAQDAAGTPAFMPPEQFWGQTSFQSDVWGIGATLYALLTGRPPFTGSEREIKDMARFEEPIAPRAVNHGVPRDLETICLKCLRKQPAHRYQTARALADDLGNLLAGRPIVARPTPLWERTYKWIRREPIKASLLVSAALALVAFGFGGMVLAAYKQVSHRSQLQQLERETKDRDFITQTREKIIANLADATVNFGGGKLNDAWTSVRAAAALADNKRFKELNTSAIPGDQETAEAIKEQYSALTNEIRTTELRVNAALKVQSNQDAIKSQGHQFARTYGQIRFLQMPLALGGVSGPDSPGRAAERTRAILEAVNILKAVANIPDPAADQPRLICEHSLLSPETRERLYDSVRNVLAQASEQNVSLAGLPRFQGKSDPAAVDATESFEAGIRMLEQPDGDLREAQRRFQRVLARSSGHYWCHFALAVCYLRQELPAQAEAHFSACESLDESRGDDHQLPWLYLLRGLAKAKQPNRSEDAEIDFARAEFLIQQERPSQETAADVGPRRPFAHYTLVCGRAYALLSDYSGLTGEQRQPQKLQDLEQKLIQATREWPDEVLAHFLLAMSYTLQFDGNKLDPNQLAESLRKANETLDVAIQKAPTNSVLRRQRAGNYFVAMDYALLPEFKTSLQAMIDQKAARLALENLQAAAQATEGLTKSALAELYFQMAFIQSRRTPPEETSEALYDINQAIGNLDLAIESDPQHVPSHLLRSQLLLERASVGRPSVVRINSLKQLQRQLKMRLDGADSRPTDISARGVARSLQELRQQLQGSEQKLDELIRAREQSNKDLAQAKLDASQVIQAGSAAGQFESGKDRMIVEGYKVRADAEELLGEVSAAYRDYSELLNRNAFADDPGRRLEILKKHGWLGLNASVEQWEASEKDFESLLLAQQKQPQNKLDAWLTEAGLACARLRLSLEDVANALESMDRLGKQLENKTGQSPSERETWRRIQHARADLYAQASLLRSQRFQSDRLQIAALQALKQAIAGNQRDVEAREYWQSYVEIDPDLGPLRDLVGYQILRREFGAISVE